LLDEEGHNLPVIGGYFSPGEGGILGKNWAIQGGSSKGKEKGVLGDVLGTIKLKVRKTGRLSTGRKERKSSGRSEVSPDCSISRVSQAGRRGDWE